MSRLVSRILPGFPRIKNKTLLSNMHRRSSDLTCYMTGLILALPPFINKTSSSTSIASMTVKSVCFTDKTHSKANFCKITNLTFNILFSIVRLKNGTQKRDQNVTNLEKPLGRFLIKELTPVIKGKKSCLFYWNII